MCRLYAIRSNEETKVECTLVHAQNALLLQSRGDQIGREHSDGWGIGYYVAGQPTIEKQASAAFRDLSFSRAAEQVYSDAVIAHVRLATVGTPLVENAHPFQYGNWLFAHNGTIQGFQILGDELLSETRPELRVSRHGSTDSECFFLWLLSRLLDQPCASVDGVSNPDRMADHLADLIQEIDERSRAAASVMGIDKAPKLNIVLTDGRSLFASRWNNSLYFAARNGITDCEICGIPHVHHRHGSLYQSVVIASEPVSEEIWHEVENLTLLYVTKDIRITQIPLGNRIPNSLFQGTSQ